MSSAELMMSSRRVSIACVVYYLMCAAIASVSVHDGYLIIFNKQIAEDEQNPVGRWLIEMNSGNIQLFLAAKLVGTVLVTSVLLLLYWKAPRLAWAVCTVIFLAQTALIFYLTFF